MAERAVAAGTPPAGGASPPAPPAVKSEPAPVTEDAAVKTEVKQEAVAVKAEPGVVARRVAASEPSDEGEALGDDVDGDDEGFYVPTRWVAPPQGDDPLAIALTPTPPPQETGGSTAVPPVMNFEADWRLMSQVFTRIGAVDATLKADAELRAAEASEEHPRSPNAPPAGAGEQPLPAPGQSPHVRPSGMEARGQRRRQRQRQQSAASRDPAEASDGEPQAQSSPLKPLAPREDEPEDIDPEEWVAPRLYTMERYHIVPQPDTRLPVLRGAPSLTAPVVGSTHQNRVLNIDAVCSAPPGLWGRVRAHRGLKLNGWVLVERRQGGGAHAGAKRYAVSDAASCGTAVPVQDGGRHQSKKVTVNHEANAAAERLQAFTGTHGLNTVVAHALQELSFAGREVIYEAFAGPDAFARWENRNSVVMHAIRVVAGEEAGPVHPRPSDDAPLPSAAETPLPPPPEKTDAPVERPDAAGPVAAAPTAAAALPADSFAAEAAVLQRAVVDKCMADRGALFGICKGPLTQLAQRLVAEDGAKRDGCEAQREADGDAAEKEDGGDVEVNPLADRLAVLASMLVARRAMDAQGREFMVPTLRDWAKETKLSSRGTPRLYYCRSCKAGVPEALYDAHRKSCAKRFSTRARITETLAADGYDRAAVLASLYQRVGARNPGERVPYSRYDGVWDAHFQQGVVSRSSWIIERPAIIFRNSAVQAKYALHDIRWSAEGLSFCLEITKAKLPLGWHRHYRITIVPDPRAADTLVGVQTEGGCDFGDGEEPDTVDFKMKRSKTRTIEHLRPVVCTAAVSKSHHGSFGVSCSGSYVTAVAEGSSACLAGVCPRSRIVAVNGEAVTNDTDVVAVLARAPPVVQLSYALPLKKALMLKQRKLNSMRRQEAREGRQRQQQQQKVRTKDSAETPPAPAPSPSSPRPPRTPQGRATPSRRSAARPTPQQRQADETPRSRRRQRAADATPPPPPPAPATPTPSNAAASEADEPELQALPPTGETDAALPPPPALVGAAPLVTAPTAVRGCAATPQPEEPSAEGPAQESPEESVVSGSPAPPAAVGEGGGSSAAPSSAAAAPPASPGPEAVSVPAACSTDSPCGDRKRSLEATEDAPATSPPNKRARRVAQPDREQGPAPAHVDAAANAVGDVLAAHGAEGSTVRDVLKVLKALSKTTAVYQTAPAGAGAALQGSWAAAAPGAAPGEARPSAARLEVDYGQAAMRATAAAPPVALALTARQGGTALEHHTLTPAAPCVLHVGEPASGKPAVPGLPTDGYLYLTAGIVLPALPSAAGDDTPPSLADAYRAHGTEADMFLEGCAVDVLHYTKHEGAEAAWEVAVRRAGPTDAPHDTPWQQWYAGGLVWVKQARRPGRLLWWRADDRLDGTNEAWCVVVHAGAPEPHSYPASQVMPVPAGFTGEVGKAASDAGYAAALMQMASAWRECKEEVAALLLLPFDRAEQPPTRAQRKSGRFEKPDETDAGRPRIVPSTRVVPRIGGIGVGQAVLHPTTHTRCKVLQFVAVPHAAALAEQPRRGRRSRIGDGDAERHLRAVIADPKGGVTVHLPHVLRMVVTPPGCALLGYAINAAGDHGEANECEVVCKMCGIVVMRLKEERPAGSGSESPSGGGEDESTQPQATPAGAVLPGAAPAAGDVAGDEEEEEEEEEEEDEDTRFFTCCVRCRKFLQLEDLSRRELVQLCKIRGLSNQGGISRLVQLMHLTASQEAVHCTVISSVAASVAALVTAAGSGAVSNPHVAAYLRALPLAPLTHAAVRAVLQAQGAASPKDYGYLDAQHADHGRFAELVERYILRRAAALAEGEIAVLAAHTTAQAWNTLAAWCGRWCAGDKWNFVISLQHGSLHLRDDVKGISGYLRRPRRPEDHPGGLAEDLPRTLLYVVETAHRPAPLWVTVVPESDHCGFKLMLHLAHAGGSRNRPWSQLCERAVGRAVALGLITIPAPDTTEETEPGATLARKRPREDASVEASDAGTPLGEAGERESKKQKREEATPTPTPSAAAPGAAAPLSGAVADLVAALVEEEAAARKQCEQSDFRVFRRLHRIAQDVIGSLARRLAARERGSESLASMSSVNWSLRSTGTTASAAPETVMGDPSPIYEDIARRVDVEPHPTTPLHGGDVAEAEGTTASLGSPSSAARSPTADRSPNGSGTGALKRPPSPRDDSGAKRTKQAADRDTSDA